MVFNVLQLCTSTYTKVNLPWEKLLCTEMHRQNLSSLAVMRYLVTFSVKFLYRMLCLPFIISDPWNEFFPGFPLNTYLLQSH